MEIDSSEETVMDSSNDDDLLRSESSFLPVYSPLKKSADFSERNFHVVFDHSQQINSWEIGNKVDSPTTNDEFPIMTEEEANKLIHLAATILQSRIRGYLVRRTFNYKTYKRNHDAACKIQALWRGYYFRCLSEQGRIIRDERRMARLQKYIAALCIDVKKQRRHESEKKQLVEAVTILYEKMTQLYDVVDAQNAENRIEREKKERKAAIVLQKRWRGYLARKVRYLEALLQLNGEKPNSEKDGVPTNPVFLPHPRYKSKENYTAHSVQRESCGKDSIVNTTAGSSNNIDGDNESPVSCGGQETGQLSQLGVVPSSESMPSESNSEYWSVPESFTGEQYTTQMDSQKESDDRRDLSPTDEIGMTHHVDQTGTTHPVAQTGTTSPVNETGTTRPVAQTGTTSPADQTGTTQLVSQTGTTHLVDQTWTTRHVNRTVNTCITDGYVLSTSTEEPQSIHGELNYDAGGVNDDTSVETSVQRSTTEDGVQVAENYLENKLTVADHATVTNDSIELASDGITPSICVNNNNIDRTEQVSVSDKQIPETECGQTCAAEAVTEVMPVESADSITVASTDIGISQRSTRTNDTESGVHENEEFTREPMELSTIVRHSDPTSDYVARETLPTVVTSGSDAAQSSAETDLIKEVSKTDVNVSPRLGQRATSLLSALKTELTDAASAQAHLEG